MADAGDQVTQAAGNINPMYAIGYAANDAKQRVEDAATNAVESAKNAVKGAEAWTANKLGPQDDAPAVLMQPPPNAQAKFIGQHQASDNIALLRQYYQEHPEVAAADPLGARRYGVHPPEQQQQAEPGTNPDQLAPGQKPMGTQQREAEREKVEGAAPELAETTGDKVVDFGLQLPGSAVTAGLKATGATTPQHAETAGNVVNLATAGYGLLKAGLVVGGALYGAYHFAETPEQIAIASEIAKAGTAGEPAARAVTPEAMYTTDTETPGKNVTPGAGETRFHGSRSGPIQQLNPVDTTKESNSYLGRAFYTTGHGDVASSYGDLHQLRETTPSKLIDVDKPIPPEVAKKLPEGLPTNDAWEFTHEFEKQGLGSRDEAWQTLQKAAEPEGYNGVTGAAGKGSFIHPIDEPHRINAYWHPESDLELAGAGAERPVAGEGGKPAAQEATPASASAESVGAAAYNPMRDMEQDLSVGHTMPDQIARAVETPLGKDEFYNFKVNRDPEEGHWTLNEPITSVDALRISHYAGKAVGELQDAAKAAEDAGGADPVLNKAMVDKAAEIRDEVLPRWSGMRHQIGLALKVLGKPTSDMRNMLLNTKELLSDVDFSQPGELMHKLASLDVAGQSRLLSKINQPDFWDHLTTLWQAQKLGPNTALKKWGSDAMMLFYQPVERYASALVSQTVGSGDITFAQANAYLRGFINSIGDGMRVGRESERADKALFDAQMGFGEGAHKALGSAGTPLEGTMLGHAYDLYANIIHELGGRRILYPDQTAKYIHYSAESSAIAMEKAEDEVGAAGTAAQKLAAYQHFLENPTKDMQARAFDYARAQTFSTSMQNLKFVQEFRKTPVGRVLLPFFPTPVNIASRGTQQVGLGPLTTQWWRMFNAGGAQRDMAVARQALGMGIAGGLVHMWMSGRLQGDLSKNPDVRKLQVEQGHVANSIILGDHKMELSYLPEPLGDMIGMVASTADTANRLPVDYDDPNTSVLHQRIDNVGNALALALVDKIHDQSFFKTLSAVMHFVGDDKSPPADRMKYLRSIAGGVAPAALADIAHWWDPIRRDIRGTLDQVQAEVPGLSEKLPAQQDMFGRDVTEPSSSATFTGNLLTSPRLTANHHDPVDDEVIRLEYPAPPIPKAFGGPARGPMSQDSPRYGVPLSPAEQRAFNTVRGQIATDSEGHTMHEALGAMISTPEYKQANDIVKRQMIDQIYTQFQGMAKEWMMENAPGLQQRIEKRQEQRAQMMGAQ